MLQNKFITPVQADTYKNKLTGLCTLAVARTDVAGVSSRWSAIKSDLDGILGVVKRRVMHDARYVTHGLFLPGQLTLW
jgi:hypothetical protein